MLNSTLFKKALKKGLKIGYLDIETSPYLNWSYPLYKANISAEQIILTMKVTSVVIMSEKDLVPITYKWKWEPIIIDKEGVRGGGNDKELLTEIQKKIKNYDILIAQNGDSYDFKVLQWRLYEEGLKPIINLVTIDTLKLSRRSFRPPNHKLDTRSKVAKLGGKIHQTMEDCVKVAQGNEKTQELRIKYNIKDVTDLRTIFWKECNYYNFHQKTLNMLRAYIREDIPFCLKCAARRQKRFEIKRVKKKGIIGGKWQCQNCKYSWKIKPGEYEAYLQYKHKHKNLGARYE